MSHYYPRQVSGLDMPILRRNNCTNTASGILALELSERSYIKHVEYSNVTYILILNCALKLVEEIKEAIVSIMVPNDTYMLESPLYFLPISDGAKAQCQALYWFLGL